MSSLFDMIKDITQTNSRSNIFQPVLWRGSVERFVNVFDKGLFWLYRH